MSQAVARQMVKQHDGVIGMFPQKVGWKAQKAKAVTPRQSRAQ